MQLPTILQRAVCRTGALRREEDKALLRGQLALGVSGGRHRTPVLQLRLSSGRRHRGGPVSWVAEHTEGAKELTLAAAVAVRGDRNARGPTQLPLGGEKAGGRCCHAPVWGFACL